MNVTPSIVVSCSDELDRFDEDWLREQTPQLDLRKLTRPGSQDA